MTALVVTNVKNNLEINTETLGLGKMCWDFFYFRVFRKKLYRLSTTFLKIIKKVT